MPRAWCHFETRFGYTRVILLLYSSTALWNRMTTRETSRLLRLVPWKYMGAILVMPVRTDGILRHKPVLLVSLTCRRSHVCSSSLFVLYLYFLFMYVKIRGCIRLSLDHDLHVHYIATNTTKGTTTSSCLFISSSGEKFRCSSPNLPG